MNLSLYIKNDGPNSQFKLVKQGQVLKVQFTRASLADLPSHTGVFYIHVQPSSVADETGAPVFPPPKVYAVQERLVEDFSQLHSGFQPTPSS